MVSTRKRRCHTAFCDGAAEILSINLSSLSQEEARSISENVTWGLRKKFADGKFSVGYSRFLGYDKGEDGNLTITSFRGKSGAARAAAA